MIGGEALQAIFEPAIGGIAGVALRHDDEVGIELVLHIDGGAVAGDRLLQRHHLEAGALGAALALDRLIVDAHAGNPGADAFANHAAHRHDAAMAGVAVHDDRKLHRTRDPAGDLDAFHHGGGADIGEAGIGADDAAGADEGRLAAGALHDPGMRRGRRMHDRQHLALPRQQLAQAGTRRAGLLRAAHPLWTSHFSVVRFSIVSTISRSVR